MSSLGLLLPLQLHATGEQVLHETNIDVIEVYAQKRAQKIEEVGIAISQVKGDVLKAQHYKDSTEL
ncbi:hypothetical protein ACKI2C_50410, partial [Streptomyces brasiliscabiei]|uniref:hypothetical protein n=1 Tax=Streptomyces brasiliscabiei TaxID=2736302 RepID=UPI0038F66291